MSNPPSLGQTLSRFGALILAVRRQIAFRRRLIAAGFAALAVTAALQSVNRPATADVLVAAHSLPAGHVVLADDLRSVAFPLDAVPAGLADDAVGRELLVPLSAGEPVLESRLDHPTAVDAYPGTVAMPVRLSDAQGASLLSPGDQITLLSVPAGGGSATVLATALPVLSVPSDEQTGLQSGSLPGRIVVIAAPPGAVEAIAEAGLNAFVTFTW